MKDFDVVIVGSGAAGGIVAGVLAEAGKRVLLLERGRLLNFEEVGRDNVRNQRISLYGHNAGPDINGNPRVYVDPSGNARTVRPHEGGYNNNAATVGGGTRVYGAQTWRFMKQDFRMASTYGVPDGSSLADWPIDYDEMEPYYDRAEWEVGVAGDDDANKHQAPRKRGYPMPAVRTNESREIMSRGAASLGWSTHPIPLAINTIPRHGRPACIECSYCVGFACPTDSKNGSLNTLIPRALASGNCKLVTSAMVEQIDSDALGRVTGVTYLMDDGSSITRHTVTTAAVVSSGGAIESARLLLNSRSAIHPNGLGNEHDQVGRNLQGHYYPGAIGVFPQQVHHGIGPGVTISTCQFNHGNEGIVGGGMLANEFIKLPIIFWKGALPPDLPRWGQANKDWMRENYNKTIHITGPVQDIPNAECRVTLDHDVRDRFGIPVVRLSGTTHPETVKTSLFMRNKAVEWLEASGAEKVWTFPVGLGMSGGQHQAGTCRMGMDPKTSVTDPTGRVHGHDNLWVVDGSLHVTNGGFNPVLTIMALAFRSAEKIATSL